MNSNATTNTDMPDLAQVARAQMDAGYLTQDDLDEVVYDLCSADASRAANNGADGDGAHDHADARAAMINNGGIAAQVDFLKDTLGLVGATTWLRAANADM